MKVEHDSFDGVPPVGGGRTDRDPNSGGTKGGTDCDRRWTSQRWLARARPAAVSCVRPSPPPCAIHFRIRVVRPRGSRSRPDDARRLRNGCSRGSATWGTDDGPGYARAATSCWLVAASCCWGRDAVQTRPGGAGCRDPGRVGIVSGESDRGGGAGLVLGGGGARGAYASGALSVLLRELKDQVRVIVGTSAGALISAYLAANWHRSVEEAIEDGLQLLARAAVRGRVRAADGAWRGGSVRALRRRVSAGEQPARPVDPAPRTAEADARQAGGLRPAGREHPRAAVGARGGRDPRAQQPLGRLSPGRNRATPRRSSARDRVRRDPRTWAQSISWPPRRSRRCSRPCA